MNDLLTTNIDSMVGVSVGLAWRYKMTAKRKLFHGTPLVFMAREREAIAAVFSWQRDRN
jgi:hypothetical protein